MTSTLLEKLATPVSRREELISHVEEIFHTYGFNECCDLALEVIRNETGMYKNLPTAQYAEYKENIAHAEYSIEMHRQLFWRNQDTPLDEKFSLEEQAKEALEIELMAVLRSWPEVQVA